MGRGEADQILYGQVAAPGRDETSSARAELALVAYDLSLRVVGPIWFRRALEAEGRNAYLSASGEDDTASVWTALDAAEAATRNKPMVINALEDLAMAIGIISALHPAAIEDPAVLEALERQKSGPVFTALLENWQGSSDPPPLEEVIADEYSEVAKLWQEHWASNS